MPFKYIGRTTDFKGKTLWEIVGNLKNFGVGRIIARGMNERYPEPCFMKIIKVEALPNPEKPSLDDFRKVKVVVERTFRGRKLPEPVFISTASYKTDYKLIPKDEEESYCKCDVPVPAERIVPKTMSFPPLLKELIIRELRAKGESVEAEPKMEIVYRQSNQGNYRVAEDGEIPNVEIIYGLGTPASPNLYKGVKL